MGWGGLADYFDDKNPKYLELKSLMTEEEYSGARESTLTAFYTPPIVIKAMYKALENLGFEKNTFPDSFFDIAVGNVPFGNFQIADKRYDKYKFMVHDYFLPVL